MRIFGRSKVYDGALPLLERLGVGCVFVHYNELNDRAVEEFNECVNGGIAAFYSQAIAAMVAAFLTGRGRRVERRPRISVAEIPSGPHLDGDVELFAREPLWDVEISVEAYGRRDVPAVLISFEPRMIVGLDLVHNRDVLPVLELVASIIEAVDRGSTMPDLV